jgi:pyruvate formate lyase activating enzyme
VREANLLPYHRLGEGKYAQLGKAYPLEGRGALPDEVLDDIADRFEARGLEVTVYNHG